MAVAGAGELLNQDASGAAAAAAEEGPSATRWGDALEAAVAALLRYSGAAKGDRTMLDALIPAQQHFARALQEGKPQLSVVPRPVVMYMVAGSTRAL